MKGDALLKISKAIVDRVQEALPSPEKIAIAAPFDRGVDATLLLFPYKILVNGSLRNTERTLTPGTDGSIAVVENALPLDVTYLLTVKGLGADQAMSADSLASLGAALRALQVDPLFSGPALDGDTVRISMEAPGAEELSRIWALFPTANYRTSIVFVASPVWLDTEVTKPAARVVDDRRASGQRAA